MNTDLIDGPYERTISGETWNGIPVAAYRETHPEHGDKFGYSYSGHWSTPNWKHPNVKVERLFTEEALTQADARIARLEEDRARYQWLANAVLCCDYGDNDQGGAESPDRIGWAIRLTRRNAIPFIFGQSIDAAIDTALKGDI